MELLRCGPVGQTCGFHADVLLKQEELLMQLISPVEHYSVRSKAHMEMTNKKDRGIWAYDNKLQLKDNSLSHFQIFKYESLPQV